MEKNNTTTMTTTTMKTPEEILLNPTALSLLRALTNPPHHQPRHLQSSASNIHFSNSTENQASDADGGQNTFIPPTPPPTTSPTTYPPTSSPSVSTAPTISPTGHPTLRGQEFILRGVVWYDRNANGVRDSNVDVGGFNDVEFRWGLGGVSVQLVQCDPMTGQAYEPQAGETLANYAVAVTQGFDALMRPQIVPTNDQNGKFNIRLPGLELYYYVQVEAPADFLFTSGICNDNEVGWHCNYDSIINPNQLAAPTQRPNLGITTGRSTSCVYVDNMGSVQAPINFGIMKVGDTQGVATNVALVLAFDDMCVGPYCRRRLSDVLRRATMIDEEDDGHVVTTRYLLGEQDKAAIGTVTAEVLAMALDRRLAKNDVELDSVDPKEVILSSSRPSKDGASAPVAGNQLAVAMEIKGHYSPPPELDFDYMVQDSINRDTATIRRGLRDYNSNCRDQTSKVNEQGLGEEDFNAVASTSGAAGVGGGRPADDSLGNVFSTACSSDFLVPDYFETSLKEIEARKMSDVTFDDGAKVVYIAEEVSSGLLETWAMGPIAGIAGLIVLLTGALVFRRALGPRYVDMYVDSKKTKNVGDEMRRFGEEGGDVDDGSVDSAFYSDDSDDSDLEETDKERKMRRKKKDKDNEQRGLTKSSKSRRRMSTRSMGKKLTSSRNMGLSKKKSRRVEGKLAVSQGSNDTESGLSKKKSRRVLEGKLAVSQGSNDTESGLSKKKKSRRVMEGKLAVSQGSNDTESLGKDSESSEEVEKNRDQRKRSASRKERSEKKSSSSSNNKQRDSSDRKPRRGRSKRSGGDNAKSHDDSRIV